MTILGSNYHRVLSEALFGTSDLSSEGMTRLQSLLSPTSSPESGDIIHTVESAYHLILEEIFPSISSIPPAPSYPDLREFLQAANNYLKRVPTSRLASYQQKIETYLSVEDTKHVKVDN